MNLYVSPFSSPIPVSSPTTSITILSTSFKFLESLLTNFTPRSLPVIFTPPVPWFFGLKPSGRYNYNYNNSYHCPEPIPTFYGSRLFASLTTVAVFLSPTISVFYIWFSFQMSSFLLILIVTACVYCPPFKEPGLHQLHTLLLVGGELSRRPLRLKPKVLHKVKDAWTSKRRNKKRGN